MLSIEALTAGYRPDYPIVEGISLTLGQGEKMGIMGRNGVGKSTLAKAIMGLLPITSGQITYKGVSLPSLPVHKYRSQGIGYFMQDGLVFSNLTVRENLYMAGISMQIRDPDKAIGVLSDYFSIFNQRDFHSQMAYVLSGGERNMLALAMIMISSPGLLILDEPFAGVDPVNAKAIADFLRRYLTEKNGSFILIDQNRELVEGLTDHIWLLRNKALHQV